MGILQFFKKCELVTEATKNISKTITLHLAGTIIHKLGNKIQNIKIQEMIKILGITYTEDLTTT